MPNYTLLIIHYTLILFFSLNISNNISLADLATLLSIDFYEFTSKSSWHSLKLTPWCENIAECITFLVLLADEWLYSWLALAFTLELPENLTSHWCNYGISLGVLELSELSWCLC